ncbi:serine/threonine protein kinase [Gracilaria domingensis]|nr:serine/threonine protein kinase [Gracilaria domingensis]
MLRNCDGGLLLNLRAMSFIFVSGVVDEAHTLHQMPAWNEPVEDSRFLSQFVTHAIVSRVNACQGQSGSGSRSSSSSIIAKSMPHQPLLSGDHVSDIEPGQELEAPAATSCPSGETEHQSVVPMKYFQDRQGSSSIRQKPFSFPQSRSSNISSKALTSFAVTVSRSSLSRGKSPFHIDFSSLKLGERLGSGSYGDVFKGTFLMTPVAVKVFNINIQTEAAESNKNPSVLSRMSTMRKLQRFASLRSQNKYRDFVREVEMMSLVRHPNLVLYMGACGDPFTPLCIVSELFSGGSLYDYLHNERYSHLDRYVAVSISLCIARGMFYLHSSKPSILHRDLKSNNVLLSERKGADGVPHVAICDFGQCQLFGHEGECEMGTAAYMSPNVINHEGYEKRDDAYSFGILLHEIFTGAVPFEGMTPMQIMYQVGSEGLRPKCDRDEGIPEEIMRLVEDCWNEDKEKRPLFDYIIARLELFEASVIKEREAEETQQLAMDPAGLKSLPQLDDTEFLKKVSLAASSVSSGRAVSPQGSPHH